MSIYIKVNNTEYPAEINGSNADITWDRRRTKDIRLRMSASEAAALLPDNTPWSIVQRDTVPTYDNQTDEQTGTQEIVQEFDNSEYCISGPITDHRNGTVSIKMGIPTEAESANAAVTALAGSVITPQRAVQLRPMIEAAAVSLSDSEAAKSPELIARWSDRIGETVEPGDRRSDTDADGVLRVYKVREGQGHTTQESWPPHLTPALWVVVDIDHAGTADDPIPAARGMEYVYGLYYKDGEDGKLYLCERTGSQAGEKITLQFLPHELVGQYFTEVAA